MIFVDTGAWYASLVPSDPDHAKAMQWLAKNRSPLLTTDYIVDETLTLLRVRGERRRALLLGTKTFEHFGDKNWSFTDCTSKVVMEQLGIDVAFAFDHHFHQFGTIKVVP